MLPENPTFLIRGDDGQEYGPVGLDELREWVAENRAGLGTVVRRDEPDATWDTWQTHSELVALLAEVHVTSPVPGQPGLVIAPLGRRVLAFGLDLFFNSLLATPIFVVLALVYMPDWTVQFGLASIKPESFPPAPLPLNDQLIGNFISDIILSLYMAGFHAAHGKTPAKAIFHIRVVDQNGQKPGPARSFIRAIVLIFSMNLFFIPLAYAFFNPQRRTFHDFVAGTYVVEA